MAPRRPGAPIDFGAAAPPAASKPPAQTKPINQLRTSGGGGSSGGGGGSTTYKPTDADKYMSSLQAAGYTPEQASEIYSRYQKQVTKQETLKGLPKEFVSLLNQYDSEQLAKPNPDQQQTLFDPLAMQMFFKQTIAPYLKDVSSRLQQTGAAAAKSINVNSLPPAYRSVMQQYLPVFQQGQNNLGAAFEGAAVANPLIDQLHQQLAAAIQAQNYDRYIRERDQAYAGGLGAVTNGVPAGLTPYLGTGNNQAVNPTSSQLDQIKTILGQQE